MTFDPTRLPKCLREALSAATSELFGPGVLRGPAEQIDRFPLDTREVYLKHLEAAFANDADLLEIMLNASMRLSDGAKLRLQVLNAKSPQAISSNLNDALVALQAEGAGA